jgi:hypothetical protein
MPRMIVFLPERGPVKTHAASKLHVYLFAKIGDETLAIGRYTQLQLESEIARLKWARLPSGPYEDALEKLKAL